MKSCRKPEFAPVFFFSPLAGSSCHRQVRQLVEWWASVSVGGFKGHGGPPAAAAAAAGAGAGAGAQNQDQNNLDGRGWNAGTTVGGGERGEGCGRGCVCVSTCSIFVMRGLL